MGLGIYFKEWIDWTEFFLLNRSRMGGVEMKKRNYLSAEDAKIIIDEWGNKTIEELAEMF